MLPIMYDPVLCALVNNLMRNGQKARARRFIVQALDYVEKRKQQDPVVLFHEAIEKVSPLMKLSSAKRAARTILTPRALNEKQRRRAGITWLLNASEEQKGPPGKRIGKEILNILDGKSPALIRKHQLHKTALMNRGNVIMKDRKMRKF